MLQLRVTVGKTDQTATAKEYTTAQLFPRLPLNRDINLELSIYWAADLHKAGRKVITSNTFPHPLSN